jgi:hypothetical protein
MSFPFIHLTWLIAREGFIESSPYFVFRDIQTSIQNNSALNMPFSFKMPTLFLMVVKFVFHNTGNDTMFILMAFKVSCKSSEFWILMAFISVADVLLKVRVHAHVRVPTHTHTA